jgi:hypothetical protein
MQTNIIRFILFKITVKWAGTPLKADKKFIIFFYIVSAWLHDVLLTIRRRQHVSLIYAAVAPLAELPMQKYGLLKTAAALLVLLPCHRAASSHSILAVSLNPPTYGSA